MNKKKREREAQKGKKNEKYAELKKVTNTTEKEKQKKLCLREHSAQKGRREKEMHKEEAEWVREKERKKWW